MSNTSNIQRLRLKQVPIDVWSTREKLALASSVARSGDQNWYSVSRPLKAFGEPNRPADWFSQKNCALQYSDLLEKVETPKRKRGERGEETAEDLIVRKLANERIEELKSLIKVEREKWLSLKNELKTVQSGQADEALINKIKERHEENKRLKQIQEKELEIWLKEREAKHAQVRAFRSTSLSKASKQTTSALSPLPQEQESIKSEVSEEKITSTESSFSPNSDLINSTLSSTQTSTTTTTVVETTSPSAKIEKPSTETSTEQIQTEKIKEEKIDKKETISEENSETSSLLSSVVNHTVETENEVPTNEPSTLKQEITDDVDKNMPSEIEIDQRNEAVNDLKTNNQNLQQCTTTSENMTKEIVIKIENDQSSSNHSESKISESSSPTETINKSEENSKNSESNHSYSNLSSTVNSECKQASSPVKPKTPSNICEISIKEEPMEIRENEETNFTQSMPVKQDSTEDESSMVSTPDSKMKVSPNISRNKRKKITTLVASTPTMTRRSDRFKAIKDKPLEEDTQIVKEHPETGGKKFTLTINEEITDASMSEESLDANIKMNTSKAPSISESTPNSPASSTVHSDDAENLREYKTWKKSIMLLWRQAATHKYASLFLQPVTDDEAKGYSTVVYRPKDLTTIRKKIENGQLRTTSEFQRDIMLMFQNAIMYNSADHEVHQMAIEMQKEILEGIEDFIETQQQQQTGNQNPESSTSKSRGRRSGISTPVIDASSSTTTSTTQELDTSIASRRKSRTSTDTDPGSVNSAKPKPKKK